jgi:hemerythrin
MYAVEFETDLVRPYIQVPDFEAVANRHARVILLLSDRVNQSTPSEKEDAIDALLKKPVHFVQDHFLSRDEANAR